jgi:hypothetical protein
MRSATVHKLVSFTHNTPLVRKKVQTKMEIENLPPSLKPTKAKTLKIWSEKLNRCAMVESNKCSLPTVLESFPMTPEFEHKQKFTSGQLFDKAFPVKMVVFRNWRYLRLNALTIKFKRISQNDAE